MNKFLRVTLQIAVTLALVGCAITPQVFTDSDPSQSFDSYRSFAWISESPMIVTGDRGPSPMVAGRLQKAIKNTLEQKGFQYKADASEADFVVAYTVGARDKMETRQREIVEYYGDHWRWGYEYHRGVAFPRGLPRKEVMVTTREYAEGSLAIDIFDAQRKSPVWHGSASKRLTRAELQGESGDSTLGAVQTILADFPPQ